MEETVFLNGRLIPRSQALVSAFDHGFLYGYGLFETMRAYRGRIFRLHQHLNRLKCSAMVLGLSAKLELQELEEACYEVLGANGLSEASIRLSLSGGEGAPLPDPSTCSGATLLVVARAYTPPPKYEVGFKGVLSEFRRDSVSPLSRLKTSSYLTSYLARQRARQAGAEEAILLNEKGMLTEGTTTNIFIIQGGRLLTPPVESGLLPGITREAVLELASSLSIEAGEVELHPHDLGQADEAFLTNSLIEIMPLTRLDGAPIGPGKPGPQTERLAQAYREQVRKETA